MSRRIMAVSTLLFILVFSLSLSCQAGILDDFETDATKPKKEHTSRETNDDEDENDDDSSSCLGIGFDILFNVLFRSDDSDPVYTGSTSSTGEYEEVKNGLETQGVTIDEEPDEEPLMDDLLKINRAPGQPLLPFARFDITYQDVSSDVDAMDYTLQGGYGPFALVLKKTRYSEDIPEENRTDKLNINQAYAMFRLSPGSIIEIDLGLGVYELDGNSTNSGPAFTLPVLIYPNDHMGIELRPAWTTINSNDISDFELSLNLGAKYISAKAGYRWLESDTMNLNGPFAGLTLRY